MSIVTGNEWQLIKVGQELSREELQQRTRLLEPEASRRDEAEDFAEAVLHSLSAHIAILDRNGIIIQTNHAWKEFAQANQIQMRPDTVAINYIQLCESAIGDSAEGARDVAGGIKAVIDGVIDEFVIDYPCHSPHEKRWSICVSRAFREQQRCVSS